LQPRDYSPNIFEASREEEETRPRRVEDALSTSGDYGTSGAQSVNFGSGFLEIVNEDKLTAKERKREAEKAMKAKKRQIKLARKMEKCAVMLQNWFRGKFARAVAKRLRRRNLFALAASSGVLLACEGTTQGGTGWYQQTEDSIPVYYEVNEKGEWKLVV